MQEDKNKMKFEGFDTQSSQVEELSKGQLKWGYWFVTHRKQFKNAGTFALMFFGVITLGYSLLATGYYFIFEY